MSRELVFDIGGVYELVMVEGKDGYHGHYINKRTGVATTFSAPGLTKKQILTKFWIRAKENIA
jgi:hypothetical protein